MVGERSVHDILDNIRNSELHYSGGQLGNDAMVGKKFNESKRNYTEEWFLPRMWSTIAC